MCLQFQKGPFPMTVILGFLVDGSASQKLLQMSPLAFVGSLRVASNGQGFKGVSGAGYGVWPRISREQDLRGAQVLGCGGAPGLGLSASGLSASGLTGRKMETHSSLGPQPFPIQQAECFQCEEHHRSLTGSPATLLSLKMIQMQSWAGDRTAARAEDREPPPGGLAGDALQRHRRPFSVTLGNLPCSGLWRWGPPLTGKLTHESRTGNKMRGEP